MIRRRKRSTIPWGWLRAALYGVFWLVIVLVITFLGPKLAGGNADTSFGLENIKTNILSWLVLLAIALVITFAFRKWIDLKSFASLGWQIKKFIVDLPIGVVLAALLMAIGSFVLSKLNLIDFNAGELALGGAGLFFLFFLIQSTFEELIFRGYILNNLMDSMNKYIALIISALVFAIAHWGNPSFDLLPKVNLILAGILLGATYIFTRNLWFPIGLHLGWNFFQGPVFGYEVSGYETTSVFEQDMEKSNILTGGDFGFEGSILATGLMVLATLGIIWFYSKRKQHA